MPNEDTEQGQSKPERRRDRVTVVYKSGAMIDLTCESLKVTVGRVENDLREVSWVDASPRPLYMGLDQVAAIWEYVDD